MRSAFRLCSLAVIKIALFIYIVKSSFINTTYAGFQVLRITEQEDYI